VNGFEQLRTQVYAELIGLVADRHRLLYSFEFALLLDALHDLLIHILQEERHGHHAGDPVLLHIGDYVFETVAEHAFQALGHEVVAIGDQSEEDWTDRFSEHKIRYIQAFVQRNGTNPLRDLKTLASLKQILRTERPDKIFTYQAKTVIYGTIAANQLGLKEVYPLIAGMGSVFLGTSVKEKIVKTILCTEYRYAMRKCPAVFFQNNDDVDMFRQNHIIKKQKVQLLHGSGVNLDRFTVQPLPETFGLLCIARLIKDKGVVEYLDACRLIKQAHPEVRCLLVGPFDSNPSAITPQELQAYIDDGVIEYFGEQSDVIPYIAQCSVYVLPSYREGTPKTVLEAMACGRAVITTDAPGCRETVENNTNGYLVPVKDVPAIAAAAKTLISNRTLLESMAKEGRRLAETRFDVKAVNKSVINTMGL